MSLTEKWSKNVTSANAPNAASKHCLGVSARLKHLGVIIVILAFAIGVPIFLIPMVSNIYTVNDIVMESLDEQTQDDIASNQYNYNATAEQNLRNSIDDLNRAVDAFNQK